MKILHRYVLKEHLGPLTFALTALTSLLLLQYIGKHFGQLVGKGLPNLVIAEFFGLSVPLTVALTLPMAVLVSTLYAFSRLAAENEITALKASGVSLVSVLQPVLWAALGVTLVMVGFNDQILPRSNHRLSILQRDIAQTKPTFGLREQVINEVIPGKFYLRAGHLDEATNLMREVTIYDMGDPTRRRTIYADSGNMSMTRSMSDLELTLYNGNMQDVPSATPNELQRLYFDVDLIRIRNVGNQFQKTTSDSYKSDREMTVCEMQSAQERARRDHAMARTEFLAKRAAALKLRAKASEQVLNARTSAPWDVGLGRLYCNAIHKVAGLLPVQAAGAQQVIPRGPPPSTGITDPLGATMLESLRLRMLESSRIVSSYAVEIHKKFALAVACFVFVLLGAPIALRFPRGGVGLTIGVSLFVFALYYVCLIAGESLGKRGVIPPVVSMWAANVLFALVAVWLLSKIGREARTARGGDMGEMIDSIRGWVREKIGADRRRRALERAAA
ncbi:MAG TPA: LptF/LptG family permease [Gemmatimonadaceae bacterium]|nr:LptF/LptG family permease [Gemmatimonadaceae bacterium]